MSFYSVVTNGVWIRYGNAFQTRCHLTSYPIKKIDFNVKNGHFIRPFRISKQCILCGLKHKKRVSLFTWAYTQFPRGKTSIRVIGTHKSQKTFLGHVESFNCLSSEINWSKSVPEGIKFGILSGPQFLLPCVYKFNPDYWVGSKS